MKRNQILATDITATCKRMNEILKENKYLNLRLKYRTTDDEQMKYLYKRQMDALAKSIVNKKAIWL